MNPTLLRKVYALHRIKRKKLRWVKAAKEQDPEKQRKWLAKMKRELTNARRDGFRIVYIDETCFTRKTCADTEWSLPNENMTVDVAMLEEPTLALLCGVSKERGVEHFRIFEQSVNVDKFKEYVEGLRSANQGEKICLFMDNLSAHTSERSKEAMRQAGFRFIYNVPYSPDYNAIEFVFSQIKRNFKMLRARKMIGLTQTGHEAMISQAVNKIKKKDIV